VRLLPPVNEPFVFSGSAVNVLILPYEFAGGADADPNAELDVNKTERELMRLLKLDTVLTARFGSLGVITIQPQPQNATAGVVGEKCTADDIVERLLRQRDHAPKANQALIIITGLIYREGEDLFFQTKLRSILFTATSRGTALSPDELEISLQDENGDENGKPHRLAASVGADDLVFPPRRITKSDLKLMGDTFRSGIQAYSAKDLASQSNRLNLDPDEVTAFTVEAVDPEGWIKIHPYHINDSRPDDTATENPAWIPFEPSATQFLHQQLPELEFLSGAIGYFRTRQTTEGPRFGAEPSLAATAELTATVLTRYTDNSAALFDDEPRAAAKSLMGVMLARLADKGQKEKWEQASDRFAEAVSIMPENTEPRNLLALSKVALCCLVRDGFDARPAISALKDVLSLRPNDLQALANLEGVYAHLENSPAAAAATELADLPYLRKQAHAVYLVADP
jgi:hypothetical protein